MAAKKKKQATKKGPGRKTAAKKSVRKSAPKKAAKKKPAKAKKSAKNAPKKTAGKKKPAKAAKAAKKSTKKAAKKKTANKKKPAAPKTARAAKPRGKKAERVGAPKQRFRQPVAPKDTIRRPQDSEELKQKLGALHQATSQIRSLKRSLNKSFYEVGQILRKIETERLYEVKGYGSFEAFVDREIDLGKQLSLKIVRIVQIFLRDAAVAAGLERVTAALDALEDEGAESSTPQAPPTTSSGSRSPIPFHKQ